MAAYDFQLLLKHLLEQGVAWAPDQEIVYRDQLRHTYADMYQRVLRLASALQRLGLREGAMIGVVGAAVGCNLGWLVLLAINQAGGIDFSFASEMGDMTALMGDRLYASIKLADILSYGIMVAVMAVLASLIPAWQAARKEPAVTLHHV